MVFPLFGVDSTLFLEFPDLNVRAGYLVDYIKKLCYGARSDVWCALCTTYIPELSGL